MGGFSFWHWLVVMLVVGALPVLVLYVLIRAAVRGGIRDGRKD